MTRPSRPSRHRRAFTLTEILSVLLLLGTVSLVMTRTFRSTMRIVYDAPVAENAIRSTSAMLAQLRADAWAASDIRSPASDRVTFRIGNATCEWRIGKPDGRFERVNDGAVTTWPALSEPADSSWFTNDGEVLILHTHPTGRREEAAISLPSAIRVINRRGDAK